jgi:dihydroflavonol-4-reductase
VRNPHKPKGMEHLHALADAHPGRLTLHKADLLDEGSFDDAMQGCQLVVHTASPFTIGKVRDPHEQFVRPALEGTRNVLNGVNRTDSVKRVVLTSSCAAIYGDNVDMQGKDCFVDTDWNTTSSLDHQPYSYSKTVADREAWRIQSEQDRWDLVTVNPSLVLGPSLTTATESGSMATMRHFTDMSMAFGAPALQFGVVDVRDAARTHIAAGFTPAAHGRYIASSEIMSMLDIAKVLRAEFGRRFSFPSRELPKPMIKFMAPVAGLTREFVERNVGWPLRLDNSRTRADLGVQFRPAPESVIEHYRQMTAHSR